MKKIFAILMIMVFTVVFAACGDNLNSEDAPEMLLVGDLPGQEEVYFGMSEEDLIAAVGYPIESEEGMLWYDLDGSYYGLTGSIGFGFSDKGRLNNMVYSFTLDLVGQALGDKSDVDGLYSSLSSKIAESLGEPTSKTDSKTMWELESQTVSLSQREGVNVGGFQLWLPE